LGLKNMADTSKSKNFEFPKMASSWLGYVSSIDKTNVVDNVYVQDSQNVYKKLSGNIAVRPGQKRRGVANSTASPISSEFVWNTSWGNTYVLTVSNSTLYAVINDVWYTLVGSLTSTRYVFDKWWDNSAKKDKLVFVNGTDNMYSWGGGFGFISSTTINTIVLDRTVAASFLSASGSVVINGTTYTYSGSAGSTLTGVSGDPRGEANGSGVLQTITTTATTPASGFNSDFLKVINNQVYVGSYTSRLVYMSSDVSFTDYTVPAPQIAGSPGLFVMDSTAKGIGVRQGNACIGFGANGWAVISFALVSNNNILVRNNKIDIKPVALLQAPLAHEFIDNVGDNLIYLGQDQQVHAFGDFNNLFVAGYPSLSQEVATELMAENFSGGALRCIGEFIYVTSPASGKTYLRQERTRVDERGNIVSEKMWHSPFTWNATSIDQIDGTVVVFSNANPQIYEVWDTGQWHDDSPSDEPLPYACVLALGYRGESRRQGLWSFDKMFTEGYLTDGTELNATMNYNYEGSTNIVNMVINSVAQPAYTFGVQPFSLGDSSLGEESLGSGGASSSGTSDLKKFKCINSLTITNCFEWQPVFYSDSADAQWEILATATNAQVETEQLPTFLINKTRL
jgi:hypothetical protein